MVPRAVLRCRWSCQGSSPERGEVKGGTVGGKDSVCVIAMSKLLRFYSMPDSVWTTNSFYIYLGNF